MREFGVHSEVGKLRTVMVCRPGLAHQRLTPGNCHDLLFDDVIWVHEAQKDHYDFVLKMRGARRRGAGSARPAGARRSKIPRRAASCSTAGSPPNAVRRRSLPAIVRALARRAAGRQARGASDRRHRDQSTCRRASGQAMLERGLRRHGLRHPADPEHAVPARPVLLDLQRRHLQPDVLAGAQAGDAAAARRLQVPSALQGRRLQDLVGRLRRGLRRAPRWRAATSCRSARASC